MLCSVVRTHHLGQKRRDNDPAPPVRGSVRTYSIEHSDLRRQVRVMTLVTGTGPHHIPDLIDPQLLTFNSARGMMVCGFEEVEGRRYYQGWWLQWVQGAEAPTGSERGTSG